MKKVIWVCALCLSLTVGASAVSFSVKATGGMSLLFGGDYNASVQGQNDSVRTVPGISVQSEFSKLSTGLDLGAELILHFTDSLGVGLGLGYIKASNDSTLAFQLGVFGQSLEFVPSVSAIPLTLSFHYLLPLGPRLKAHFFAGPGLYFASVRLESITIMTLGALEVVKGDLKFRPEAKAVLGFQGGAGIEFAVSRNVALVLDVSGRYLSISGLTGPATVDGHEGFLPFHIAETGTLYYYESTGAGYGELTVSDTMPSGPTVTIARAASISLSGVRFQAGFQVGF